MTQGKLIVITGPSGVGKGTIVKNLLQNHPELYLSISATTRKPRQGETDAQDYYFISKEEFVQAIADSDFLEWTEYAGNYYGTPKTKIAELLDRGNWVLLEIELVGAQAISSIFPDALRIFILPPSIEELEARIRKRGKDSESAIEQRLIRAKDEVAAKDEFDVCIINQDLAVAIEEVEKAIFT